MWLHTQSPNNHNARVWIFGCTYVSGWVMMWIDDVLVRMCHDVTLFQSILQYGTVSLWTWRIQIIILIPRYLYVNQNVQEKFKIYHKSIFILLVIFYVWISLYRYSNSYVWGCVTGVWFVLLDCVWICQGHTAPVTLHTPQPHIIHTTFSGLLLVDFINTHAHERSFREVNPIKIQ